jgi:DNA processing protein
MSGENHMAWAYLSRVAQGPCAPLTGLIEMVGVAEAARAVREWDLPESLRQRVAARRALDTAAEDLQLIGRLGGRLVTPDDPD